VQRGCRPFPLHLWSAKTSYSSSDALFQPVFGLAKERAASVPIVNVELYENMEFTYPP
jgi:hypothetical protein